MYTGTEFSEDSSLVVGVEKEWGFVESTANSSETEGLNGVRCTRI